jgi:hypothetical protein
MEPEWGLSNLSILLITWYEYSTAPVETKRIAQLIREKNDATSRYEELKRNHDFLLIQMVNTANAITPNVLQSRYTAVTPST